MAGSTKRSKVFSSFLKLVLGVILLVLILLMVDIPTLVDAILRIDPKFLALSVCTYLILNLVLSFRLYRSLKALGYGLSFGETFWAHLFGMLWSNVTPGRVGYVASTQVLHKKSGVPVLGSLSCIGVIESLELIVKAVGALSGLALVIVAAASPLVAQLGVIGIVIALFMSVTYLILCWTDSKTMNRLVERFPVYGKKLMELVKEFKSASKALKARSTFIIGISVVGWLLRGVEWTFIGYACGFSLPFSTYLALHPLLTTVRFVPVTVAGLGMFEGITILGLSFFGVSPETALVFSLLDRVDNVIVDIFATKEIKKIW